MTAHGSGTVIVRTGAGVAQRREHRLQVGDDGGGSHRRAQHVVDPGEHRREVGPQGQRRCQLLRADLPDQPAAHGQVRVLQARVRGDRCSASRSAQPR